MPLTPQQVIALAERLNEEWDLPTLELFARDHLNVQLANLAPAGSVRERAAKFVNHLNSQLPPRDGELLEKLQQHGNAALKAFALQLLKPTFFSPTGDAHEAVVLGRAAFVNRDLLRTGVREFTNPSHFTTRVMIVRGEQPCGKSYTWEFLRHLSVSTAGAVPQRLRLKNTRYSPRQIFEQVAYLLLLDTSGMPALSDDPQLARIDPLVNWFKGQVVNLRQPYWLVIDDLNDPSTTPAMREAAYGIAGIVEELKPQHLWVALLGYNPPVTDPDLRYVVQEEARFPDVSTVARHLEMVAKAGPAPLTTSRASEIATLLFSSFANLDKESMIKLTGKIEKMGERLILGQQP